MNITGYFGLAHMYSDTGTDIGRITGSSFNGVFSGDNISSDSHFHVKGYFSSGTAYNFGTVVFDASKNWTGKKTIIFKMIYLIFKSF